MVEQAQVNPLDYEIRSVPKLLDKQGDEFQEVLFLKQSIDTLLMVK